MKSRIKTINCNLVTLVSELLQDNNLLQNLVLPYIRLKM